MATPPTPNHDGRLLADEKPLVSPDGYVLDADPHDGDDSRGRTGARSSRNPFVIALWVLSAGLVAMGLVAFEALRSLSSGIELGTSQDQWYFLLVQAVGTAAPSFILLGLATVVALLFFHAVMREWGERAQRGRERDLL